MTEGVVEATPGSPGVAPSGGGPAGFAARPPLRRSVTPANLLGVTVADLTFLTWVVAVPLLFGDALLNTDGDLARHIRVGSEFIRRGLLHQDIFSFTKPGAPFVPYEWLSEVITALVHGAAGLAGVAVFAGILVAVSYASLVRFLEHAGVDPLLAWLTGMVAAMLGASHWLARPHLFTLIGAVWVMAMLERRQPRLRWFAPVFAVWANLHGGYIFGLTLIGLYLLGDLAEWRAAANPARWKSRARFHAAALGISLAATLLTPSGIHLLGHVTGYLRQSYLVDSTDEYMSPDFHTAGGKVFLLVMCGVFALLALRRKRLSFPRLFVVLATTGFALISQRNIPLFAVTTLPLVAIHLDTGWRRLRLPALVHARQVVAGGNARGSRFLWPAVAALAMILLAAQEPRGARGPIPNAFSAVTFPVVAVARARASGIGDRVFNYFSWGGYMLYAWPEQRVFIDGQTDFYGEAVAHDYDRVQQLQPGWRDVLDRWRITAVLFPTGSALVAALSREPEWTRWYADPVATVLLRRTDPAAAISSTSPGAGAEPSGAAAPKTLP